MIRLNAYGLARLQSEHHSAGPGSNEVVEQAADRRENVSDNSVDHGPDDEHDPGKSPIRRTPRRYKKDRDTDNGENEVNEADDECGGLDPEPRESILQWISWLKTNGDDPEKVNSGTI
jgi:hypothetical protein